MANTQRKANRRKLQRAADLMENAQQHILDVLTQFPEVDLATVTSDVYTDVNFNEKYDKYPREIELLARLLVLLGDVQKHILFVRGKI